MPWYTNDNCERLWYEDQGEGPVIVLIHGWCMSSAVWRLQLESLSGSFRIIAPDLAGHGRSDKSADGYSIEGFATDIAALLRHLGLTDALLAGWSLGAQIALQVFAQVREQLAGLALIAATPCFVATDDFPAALGSIEVEGMSVKLRRHTARALEGFIARMFAPGEVDDPALSALIRDLLVAVPMPDTDVTLQSLQALADADLRDLLVTIDLPVLIINGDRDMICMPEASAYMAQQLATSSHVIMYGCGHAPFLTRSMAFDTCLSDFRRRVRARSR